MGHDGALGVSDWHRDAGAVARERRGCECLCATKCSNSNMRVSGLEAEQTCELIQIALSHLEWRLGSIATGSSLCCGARHVRALQYGHTLSLEKVGHSVCLTLGNSDQKDVLDNHQALAS